LVFENDDDFLSGEVARGTRETDDGINLGMDEVVMGSE